MYFTLTLLLCNTKRPYIRPRLARKQYLNFWEIKWIYIAYMVLRIYYTYILANPSVAKGQGLIFLNRRNV